ncbi:MAG: CubicO group peptidase (beta-lactamase class C family) [Halieaceae bacterium]|jgi:CubicO group peptidase (beta-lactamase class C family)
MIRIVRAVSFSAFFVLVSQATNAAQPLSDAESDPREMGWMQGFPPAPEKVVGQPMSNYFSWPRMRWTFCHLRDMQASQTISPGLGSRSELSEAFDTAIDAVEFRPIGKDQSMSWQESLAANYTDGLVILHKGEVVYEYYSGCLDREGRHGAMSVTKSYIGLVAELLIADGVLDAQRVVSDYVPELAKSAFGTATVRQVMDMTTALKFNEDYADPESDIWAYAIAGSPLPKPADYPGPRSYYEYLQTVQPAGEHGVAFAYKSVNTDALAWVIARASGRSAVELISERIWKPLGTEQEADILIDSIGSPFSAGGLSMGLRDAARLGQALLQRGMFAGERIFAESVVDSISEGGDPEKFAAAGYRTLPGGSYRSMWWILHNEHRAYSARGIHGQAIYVDPTAEMVIARFASYPVSFNAAIDPTSLPAYQAVAEYLLNKES